MCIPVALSFTLQNLDYDQARLKAPKKGGAKIARPNIEEDQTY